MRPVSSEEGRSNEQGSGFSKIIYGVQIQGAQWNEGDGCLTESDPGADFARLPPILLEPLLDTETADEDDEAMFYDCPLYRTETRRGEVLVSGMDSNWVVNLSLRSGGDPEMWTRRGVAAFLQQTED